MASKKLRNSAENLLDSLGIRGSFQQLIRKAIIQGWDMDEFATALMRTPQFRKAFPGLIDFQTKGIHPDFSTSGAAGASALLSAVNNYRRGFDDFQEIANRIGYPGKVSKNVFGMAVRQGVSPDEFAQRLTLVKNINANPDLLNLYNEQRKFAGLKPLGSKGDLLKAAAKQDPAFIDSYQAAYLRQAGLELTAEQAQDVATTMDSPLQQNLNLGEMVSELMRIRRDVGPELRNAGIDDRYLALLQSGQDPENRAGEVESIIASRRAMANQRPSNYLRRTESGGLGIYAEDEARSY